MAFKHEFETSSRKTNVYANKCDPLTMYNKSQSKLLIFHLRLDVYIENSTKLRSRNILRNSMLELKYFIKNCSNLIFV